jgi:hypothetical protein
VPTQEGQLGLDGPFVTAHKGLVVPAGQANELGVGTRVPARTAGPGKRNAVIVEGEHQQGT